jgi:hypothetical protein
VHRAFPGESAGRVGEALALLRRQLEQAAMTAARALERTQQEAEQL